MIKLSKKMLFKKLRQSNKMMIFKRFISKGIIQTNNNSF